MRKLRELLPIIFFIIFIITAQNGLFSDFIYETEEKTDKSGPEVDKYSKYIARNIRTDILPDIKGAVRIAWGLSKDSNDDYIVGRSSGVPDTMDKALKSLSIKVVPAGAKTEVIDSNLKTGTYYYCVLAKSKIIDREIQLYPEQNFTIIPVNIENESPQEQEKKAPQQVSLIYARILNNSQVRITWRGIEATGIAYTIYRGNAMLDSPEKLKNAEKIKVITDGRESYVDNIAKGGRYFYAVTTKDIAGNEDMNLVPDQSYTVSDIFISLEVPVPVKDISVRIVNNEEIKINWSKTSSDVAEYLVYKYTSAISDSERLGLSAFLGRVPGDKFELLEKKPGAGSYYYAVLSKFSNGKVLNDLIKDDNYSSFPAVIGSRLTVVSLSASSSGSDIELSWKTIGNLGSKSYRIVRKQSGIKSPSDIEDADIVAFINVDDYKYTDKNLAPGKYYYALIPETIADKDFTLSEGVNVVEKSVSAGRKEVEKAEKPVEKIEPEFVPEIVKKPEKKTYAGVPAGAPGSDIDAVLQKYFFTGKYKLAYSELVKIAKNSNNEQDVAKAKLFIGRTLVEQKKFQQAVDYLILKDVTAYYPKEAVFWRDYAISKLTDSGTNIINDIFK